MASAAKFGDGLGSGLEEPAAFADGLEPALEFEGSGAVSVAEEPLVPRVVRFADAVYDAAVELGGCPPTWSAPGTMAGTPVDSSSSPRADHAIIEIAPTDSAPGHRRVAIVGGAMRWGASIVVEPKAWSMVTTRWWTGVPGPPGAVSVHSPLSTTRRCPRRRSERGTPRLRPRPSVPPRAPRQPRPQG